MTAPGTVFIKQKALFPAGIEGIWCIGLGAERCRRHGLGFCFDENAAVGLGGIAFFGENACVNESLILFLHRHSAPPLLGTRPSYSDVDSITCVRRLFCFHVFLITLAENTRGCKRNSGSLAGYVI